MRKMTLFLLAFVLAPFCHAIDFNGGGTGNGSTRLADTYGFSVEYTPMDEMRVVNPVRLVGATFVGATIDPSFWTVTIVNTSTATQLNNELTVGSGSNSAGYAIVQSSRTARYVGGSANRYRGLIQLNDSGTNGNTRRWGAFDGTNGAFFQISSATFSACTLRAGVLACTASSAWNKNVAIPNLTECNSYEIYYTNKTVYFVINGSPAHYASFPSNTWSSTSNLPARIDNRNTSNTTPVYVRCRVQTIYRLGELQTAPISKHISTNTTTILKYGAGILHRVVINNPTNNSITIYDNSAASGTIIAVINPGSSAVPMSLDYDAPFFAGLTVVTAGSPDLTVVYE